jgi:hypothetical protein
MGVLKRLGFGGLGGGFLGLLEIWFYQFSLRHLLAAVFSGALYGCLLANPYQARAVHRQSHT